jgi:hypothetical protein
VDYIHFDNSGTLSPLTFFASELGTPFPIRLEASHVIDPKTQVWVGAVSCSNRVNLNCSYGNQAAFNFQDAVATAIINYSQEIPGGILVFFPSYSLLEKLVQRWKDTGAYAQLLAVKAVFTEPRKSGKDFDNQMLHFRNVIATACSKEGRNTAAAAAASPSLGSRGASSSSSGPKKPRSGSSGGSATKATAKKGGNIPASVFDHMMQVYWNISLLTFILYWVNLTE